MQIRHAILKRIERTIFVGSWVPNHEVDLVNGRLDVWSQLILGNTLAVERVAFGKIFRNRFRSSSRKTNLPRQP